MIESTVYIGINNHVHIGNIKVDNGHVDIIYNSYKLKSYGIRNDKLIFPGEYIQSYLTLSTFKTIK